MLDIAWFAAASAQSLLLILRALPLRTDWPGWTAWLAAATLQTACVVSVRIYAFYSSGVDDYGRLRIYFWTWLGTELAVTAMLVWTMIEAYRRRAEHRLVVGWVGTWITGIALVIAMAWYALTVSTVTWDRLLRDVFLARGMIMITLGASAVIVLAVYAAFPCPTAAVVVRHHRILTAFLVLRAMLAWAESISSRTRIPQIDLAYMVAAAALFLYWTWAMEPIPTMPPPSRGAGADVLDRDQATLIATVKRARSLSQGPDA